MRKLLILLLLGSGLWSGYWYAGSSVIESQVETWFANQAKTGMEVEKTGLTVAGFPNRFDLTVEGLRLRDPVSGIGWQTPFAQVFAMTWKPWHIIAAFAPEQVVTLPDQAITLTSDGLRASIRAQLSTEPPLAAFVVETNSFAATSTAGWSVAAARSVTSLSADEEVPGAGDSPNTYVYALDIADLAPDPGLVAAIRAVAIPDLPASDLPDQIETINAAIFLTLSVPLDRQIANTRPYPTRIDVSALGLTWGALALSASGAVEADGNGFAAGKITVQVTNWDRLPAVLVAMGAITPELAPTVTRGLQALAAQSPDPAVLSLPLVMSEGRMSFGPFPLGPAPLLVPPQG